MATEFSGFSDFADELDDLAEDIGDAADNAEIDRAVDRGVEQTARDVRDDASRLAPRDTGRLANSIRAERRAPGEWLVIADTDYSKHVEYGTRPHTITPNDAEALRFEIDGQTVFAKKVDHPGTGPNPYLRPSLDMHRSELARNIRREINRAVTAELSSF